MSNSAPAYQFELNCLLTQPEHNLAQVQFKKLPLEPNQGLSYGAMRDLLRGVNAIWYAEGNCIYLIGDGSDLTRRLDEGSIERSPIERVQYQELWSQRENVLRFLLHSAIDAVMHDNAFLPSISSRQRSYYPLADANDGEVTVTHTRDVSGHAIVVKHGLILDLDLSPDGPALLWLDTKLFTFTQNRATAFENGQPVYLLCNSALDCVTDRHAVLLDGAFVTADSGSESQMLNCISSRTVTSVRSKQQRQLYTVPQECLYTIAGVSELKRLGIYNWWRPKALLSTEERHQLTWHLLGLLIQDTDVLAIPLPDDQRIVFNLNPVATDVQVRFAE